MDIWSSFSVPVVSVVRDKLYHASPTIPVLPEEVVPCAVPVPKDIHKALSVMDAC